MKANKADALRAMLKGEGLAILSDAGSYFRVATPSGYGFLIYVTSDGYLERSAVPQFAEAQARFRDRGQVLIACLTPTHFSTQSQDLYVHEFDCFQMLGYRFNEYQRALKPGEYHLAQSSRCRKLMVPLVHLLAPPASWSAGSE